MQEAKLVLQKSTVLARWTRFLRPADLDFQGRPVSISISGDTVEVKLQAIFRKGLVLWFPADGQYVPSLAGLNLGPSIYCKNTGSDALYEEVLNKGILFDLRSAVDRSRRTTHKWRKGELIELELKAPCNTVSLLDFPLSMEGTKEITGDQVITRVKIRKRYESRDVVIRNYRWRRNLMGLLPLQALRLIKNGAEERNTIADIVSTKSTSGPVSSLKVINPENIETTDNPIFSNLLELSIGLSFDQPDDEYEIIFISGR